MHALFRVLALSLLATALVLALGAGSAEARSNTFVLASPANNKTVKKKVKFSALLEKNLQRRAWGIEFWVDGDRVGTDRKPPYSLNVDTRKLTNGQHTFRVSLLVKSKSGKGPDRKVCEFLRAVYVNVKNKGVRTVANKKLALPGPIADLKKQNYQLKFRDEFNGTALDRTKWNDQRDDWIIGGQPYNDREGAFYRSENTTVSKGSLNLTVKEELAGDPRYVPASFPRTTGMVNTDKRFGFKYGYIEARVRVPSCLGCWPVFWTLPTINTWPPEVDMFEFIDTAAAERRPFVASHWRDATGLQSELYYYTTPCGTTTDYTDSWHTYGFLWTGDKIQPFLDGVPGPVLTGAAVPQVPMYLILALSTVNTLATPNGSQMRTDYVRVWQPAGT
ncbi:MAG: family 16 glycosylhydrolase [Thermoleophilaceae bacterium]|nr:family 16 glycosylhydrolase [Thermoleophilaceae bacterium]